jgi:hypothetical protein
VVAWIGVMLLGFGVSGVFEWPEERRNRTLLRAGFAMTVAFLLLRAIDGYGDPNHWQWQPSRIVSSIIDFMNTTKYPPSLQYLLMTLGPAAMLCSVADRITGGIKQALVMFGRVPFAFYVAHFYLIHTLSVVLGRLQGFRFGQMMTVFPVLSEGIRAQSRRCLCRVDVGDRHSVSLLPLGRRSKSAPPGLVAQLPVEIFQIRMTDRTPYSLPKEGWPRRWRRDRGGRHLLPG